SLLCVHNGHNWGDDFAQYIEQAKAINDHSLDSYLQINSNAMAHSDYTIGPYLYPNGFPLLLAPVYRLFGLNFIALKVWCALFFLGSLVLLPLVFGKRVQKGAHLVAVVALIGLSPNFLRFSDQVLSDFPFLFFNVLSVELIEKDESYTR